MQYAMEICKIEDDKWETHVTLSYESMSSTLSRSKYYIW